MNQRRHGAAGERHQPLGRSHRWLALTELFVGVGQEMAYEALSLAGKHIKRIAERLDGLIEAAGLHQQIPQTYFELRVVRRQPHRLPVFRYRLVKAVQGFEGRAQVVMQQRALR